MDYSVVNLGGTQTNSDGIFWLVFLAILTVLALAAVVLVRWYLKKSMLERAKDWVIIQLIMPREIKKPEDHSDKPEDFKQLISVAEQFFSSLNGLHITGIKSLFGQPKLSFEITAKNKEIFFFIGCARKHFSYIERQLHSFFAYAQLEVTDNFRIFKSDSQSAYGALAFSKKYIYPIRIFKNMEFDPLNSITNVMSKIKEGDSATIQYLLRPCFGTWRSVGSVAAKSIKEGKVVHDSNWSAIVYGFFDILGAFSKAGKNEPSQPSYHLTPQQDELMKAIQEKGNKVGFKTQIRIVINSSSKEEAQINLENIIASFSQYKSPQCNSFKKVIILPRRKTFINNFILREFNFGSYGSYCILNSDELASLWHPANRFLETPNIHWMKARTLPPPADMPQEGTLIGESIYRNDRKKVMILDDDRRRHIFMIGKTGVGKTTLYLTMIKQDIENGRGCCFIDPNGDAAESILRFIPKERAEDVIYFDPSDSERPMGLNLLEWKRPEDKDYLIAEWIEIFYKLFDPNRTGMVGPQFEHWGRNAALTIMAQPGGGTLIEIPRLFVDDEFREKCISYVTDPVVQSFWTQQMTKTADFHKSEMFNYFISKFGRFMTNDIMRNIIGQAQSAFDIREAMDSGKILIINLSKGKLGEANSYLLGMILVSKIQVAAFQRADIPEEKRRDFYLYVDEFQNFTTNSFKTILSEARKYRLNLAVTNQYIKQLSEEIRDAAIGNAGTLLCYRAGAEDAEFMAKELPGVTENDITNLPFATLYVKLLIKGSPSKPFSMRGIKTEPTQRPEMAESIRQLSRLKYGKNKLSVEEDIKKRTLSQTNAAPEVAPPREA